VTWKFLHMTEPPAKSESGAGGTVAPAVASAFSKMTFAAVLPSVTVIVPPAVGFSKVILTTFSGRSRPAEGTTPEMVCASQGDAIVPSIRIGLVLKLLGVAVLLQVRTE